MTKTKPTVKKPRPKYRVQLVKSNAEGQWLHRIVGRNGEKIESSELYVRRDSARRTAKPLAEALKTTLEVVDKSKCARKLLLSSQDTM